VLSKIEFFEAASDRVDRPVDCERLQARLVEHFRLAGKSAVLTQAAGGTLGICFDTTLSGEPRFLKTHHCGERARANLAKEAEILLKLYGHAVALDCFEVQAPDGTNRLCLLMPKLLQLTAPMRAEEAAALARECNDRLRKHELESLASDWEFAHLLVYARRALAVLSERGLLDQKSTNDVRRLIGHLEDHLDKKPRQLCHGDFGPRNIMTDGVHPLVLDWEDAFCGIAGYDYLYWLTFIENRRFLHDEAFGRTGHEPGLEHAVLALIVLLKSFLAVCSGAFADHKISVQSRITEILDLRKIA
jgi:Ser/Thr protein kinase RdoA (MazF antagonist)